MANTITSRLEEALADSQALCAVVGAGDLAIEKLREAREKFDPNEFKEQANAKLHAGVEALQSDIRISPEHVMDLPVRLQAAMSDLLSSTSTTYDELVVRGRGLVGRIREQQAEGATAEFTETATPGAAMSETAMTDSLAPAPAEEATATAFESVPAGEVDGGADVTIGTDSEAAADDSTIATDGGTTKKRKPRAPRDKS